MFKVHCNVADTGPFSSSSVQLRGRFLFVSKHSLFTCCALCSPFRSGSKYASVYWLHSEKQAKWEHIEMLESTSSSVTLKPCYKIRHSYWFSALREEEEECLRKHTGSWNWNWLQVNLLECLFITFVSQSFLTALYYSMLFHWPPPVDTLYFFILKIISECKCIYLFFMVLPVLISTSIPFAPAQSFVFLYFNVLIF